MCGIVGYLGDKDISSILLVGLERLSYRGYDSSGIAVLSGAELSVWKQEGKIHQLSESLKGLSIKGQTGIGHTRWATHGVPNQINSHPHVYGKKKFAVVHNGIIENFRSIKANLVSKGHIFQSETDSEVIVQLIEFHFEGCLETAVQKTISQLEGTYAIAAISEEDPEKIIVCRKGSPLIIGLGDGENFISSDINAIVSHTKDIIYMEENELAIVTRNSVVFKNTDGNIIEKTSKTIDWSPEASEKGGFEHYMLKEIHEQPNVIRTIMQKHIQNNHIQFKGLDDTVLAQLKDSPRFIIQACGTSWHAGIIGKYLFEQYTRIPTEVDISSEFRYRHLLPGRHEFVIALSQSGETADTLACIHEAKSKFFNILSLVNVQGSSIERESDAVIHTHSGPEIGVASTKNYVAQLLNIYLLSLFLGLLKKTITEEEVNQKLSDISKLPDAVESILLQQDTIEAIADKYYQSRDFIFIGRGLNYPTALEGALKLKEISYIHSTGFPAGELKHGPIALIDEKMPVICIAPKTSTYDKMISNIQEVKARSGRIITIASEGDSHLKDLSEDIIYLPKCSEDLTPILSVIPLQLLSYHIAKKLDCNVDQPRNLAKSVTVE